MLDRLFKKIDRNHNGHLSKGELSAFVIGMHLDEINLSEDDVVNSVMKELDTERQDDMIDLREFVRGISRLLNRVRRGRASSHTGGTFKHLEAYDEVSW